MVSMKKRGSSTGPLENVETTNDCMHAHMELYYRLIGFLAKLQLNLWLAGYFEVTVSDSLMGHKSGRPNLHGI